MGDAMDVGGFRPAGERWVLAWRVDLPVNGTDAWIALTSRDGLLPWFPATIVGEWTPGQELEFTFPGTDEEPTFGDVVDVQFGRLLVFTWGGDSLRLTLDRHDDGTRLTFAASLGQRGRGARDGASWHLCLAALRESLGGYVEDADKDWDAVYARYREALGPEASTVLPPGVVDILGA